MDLKELAIGTMHLKNPDAWRAIHAALVAAGVRDDRAIMVRDAWAIRKQIRRDARAKPDKSDSRAGHMRTNIE